jgi:hypothetical protein
MKNMQEIAKFTTQPRLAGLILIALVLGGCSGAQVASNAPTNSGSGAATSAPTSAPAAAPSTPITLEGTPSTSVAAGSEYSFQPTASAGGASIAFSIAGQPTWATFSTTTGALTGTPTAAEVDSTTGTITITASAGNSSASLPPFTIQVKAAVASSRPATAGTATLSWTAPTHNTDGSPITGLAGYHIYYGTDENAPSQTITVTGPASTTYVVQGLAPGTYFFTVVAYNTSGADSTDSNVSVKTI